MIISIPKKSFQVEHYKKFAQLSLTKPVGRGTKNVEKQPGDDNIRFSLKKLFVKLQKQFLKFTGFFGFK